MTQSNAMRGPDRAVVQLPGRKGQSGAVLRVRGVPQDADVYGVVIKRGSRWLGPEGWSSDPIETPVRKSNGEAGTVDLALSETLSSEIPVGASLAIQVPGHDVSDTIIWRSLAPVAGDAASPSRAAGKSGARRAGSAASGKKRSGAGLPIFPIALGLAAIGLVVAGIAFINQSPTGPDASRFAASVTVPDGAAINCATPASEAPPTDSWDRRLYERNIQTRLREGRRLALGGDMDGARSAFAEAACASDDAAIKAAIFFDPGITETATGFGEAGLTQAIAFYKLAAERYNRTDAANRLQQIEESRS